MKSHQERANALVHQANISREKGRIDEAIRTYREAIALVPAYASFHLVIADMLFEAKRYPEAADAYRETIQAVPNHAQAWVGLGQCSLLTDHHDEAGEAFRHALAADQANPEANYYLALLLGMRGEFKEAESLLLTALTLRPAWETQARREASLKPVFENSRRLSRLGTDKKWWEVWK